MTKRVVVEACDFDWVFIDNNAEQLLYLISSNANPQMLIQKPIRIFIDTMWDQLQPILFRCVIVPFSLFILSFTLLVSESSGFKPDDYTKA